jgi:hypothetical protein
MLMVLTVLLVSVVALLRGGSLRNFSELHLRWIPLAIGSFALQLLIFTPFRRAPLIAVWTIQLYELSMALLVVWVAVNWRIPGAALMACGLLANFAAILANGGYMPVSPESARYAGQIARYATEGPPIANNSLAIDGPVQLWPLTDIIALPGWVPFAAVFSIGDVLLTLGAALLCYRTIRQSRQAEAAPAPGWDARSAVGSAPRPQFTTSELAKRLKGEWSTAESLLEEDAEVAERMAAQAARLREALEGACPAEHAQADDGTPGSARTHMPRPREERNELKE